MQEEAPAVQNWRLLVVACVLGLVVMVVYNMHIGKVRRGLAQEKVTVFRYNRNLDIDDVVKQDDLDQDTIPRTLATKIGKLLNEDEVGVVAVGQPVTRDVGKNDYVRAGDFTNVDSEGARNRLREDMVQISILIDPKVTPGRVLRVGNHVNVKGIFPTKQGTYKSFRIIERLKVVGIGGQTGKGGTSGSAQRGVRTYETVTVEMKRKDPDVSLQWGNLKTHLHGLAVLEVCPSEHAPPKEMTGKINSELKEFTLKAAVVSGGMMDGGDGY